MSVNGAFTATGNAVLSADLSVGDDLTVTGDATVGGGFTCTGAAVLSSTLAVTSNATIGGNASITGTLAATGATSLGAITCSGAAVLSSTLAVDGATNLKSGVTLGTSTSNTVTLNALLSASGSTGGTGKVLVSNGTASAPSWGTAVNQGVVKSATSGTSVTFLLSDVVSDVGSVKKITIAYGGISTSGTSKLIVQLGTASGFETTSYSSFANTFNSSPGASSETTGFAIVESVVAANTHHGTSTIVNLESNTWVHHSVVGSSNPLTSLGGGSKSLSDQLTQIRVTTVNGTDTFDAGSINIMYE
jgi:hypothetical protein